MRSYSGAMSLYQLTILATSAAVVPAAPDVDAAAPPVAPPVPVPPAAAPPPPAPSVPPSAVDAPTDPDAPVVPPPAGAPLDGGPTGRAGSPLSWVVCTETGAEGTPLLPLHAQSTSTPARTAATTTGRPPRTRTITRHPPGASGDRARGTASRRRASGPRR